VGTGSADLPLELLRLATRLGRRLQVTAIDRDPHVAAVAATRCREHAEIRIVRADAFDPPFSPGAFDVVTASMFLHHFTHEEIVRLLGRFTALARRAVIVNDLRRHRLPWLAVLLISRATRRSAMFTHDAPLSVLRGFTDEELGAAARDAGSGAFVVRRRWPFRLVLTLQGEAAA
jgi:2-polyprenyl-3-methyl-5-hydroxy-6-metoxy-1,4-benzoquinol methylase